MSERRRARAGIAATESPIPPELTSPLDPIWRDEAALAERFPELVDGRIISRLRMGGRVWQQVVSKWCMAHGFESEQYPRQPDWRRFRAACTTTPGRTTP